MKRGACFLFLAAPVFALDASRYLWYTSPGTDFASGLPFGNGRVAGLLYGSAVERIPLNENSLWFVSFLY